MSDNKPLFSTSEPEFMGMLGDVFHMHLRGNRSVASVDHKRLSIYFDGWIQLQMGYDIPYLLSGHISGRHQQECQVITPEGEYLDAYLNRVHPESDIPGRVQFYIQDIKGINGVKS